jgi:hypothetical protein
MSALREHDPYRSPQSLKRIVLVILLITLVLIGSRYFRLW